MNNGILFNTIEQEVAREKKGKQEHYKNIAYL